ncbi:GntR family transcriptional regulator [uncultured Sulfitobacter sp.]|uniref:GntR family transcriptional regulator n=1 Tax=uncultured Sulfitobacter sp. TaxID=191468 RepID=UPI00263111D5|nr:GntR family transcriptional regulator [uncultured Sulfitobacter sp.]
MGVQSQMVVETILAKIDAGFLHPGDIIAEDALIAELAISRTPLREALLQLEAQGLVIRQPRKGVVVFKPTLEEFLAILEVHARLEGQAAGLAARRLSPARGAALREVVDACALHHRTHVDGQPNDYYQLNLDFHRLVGEASGNPFLLEMIKSNARKLMAYYRARYRTVGAIGASATEHAEIAEAILDRRSDEAEALMISHVQFDHVTAMDLLASFD